MKHPLLPCKWSVCTRPLGSRFNCLFSGCFASFCWLGFLVPPFGRFSLFFRKELSHTVQQDALEATSSAMKMVCVLPPPSQCIRMLSKLPLLPCKWSVPYPPLPAPGLLIASFLAVLPLFVGLAFWCPLLGVLVYFYRKELSHTV